MSLRIVTANTDWAKRGDAAYIAHLCEAHDVVLVQEAKDTNLATVAPEGWTALQDTTDQAHTGTGILVRDSAAKVGRHGVSLGVKPILRTGKRVKMLTRYIYTARLTELATGDPHFVVSAHFPPKRFSPLQIPFRRALRKIIAGHAHVTVGTDANQPVRRLAKRLKMSFYADRIVGLLFGRGVKASGKVVSKWGIDHRVTDHPSVAAVVESVDVVKPPPPVKTRTIYPALQKARHQSHFGPRFPGPDNGAGQCRLQCRICLGTAAVGDFDGDGRADAEDAWKAAHRKHPGDRRPPRGMPVFWGGGSHDDGHEALSAGVPGADLSDRLRQIYGRENETWIWSTDILRAGFFDYVPLSLIEEKWGLPYLGWTEDDAGVTIVPAVEVPA